MQILSLFISFTLIIAIKAFGMKHDWTYEFKEITNECSDKDQVDVDLRVERKGREDFVFSGYVDVKVPLTDSTLFEVLVERSATGSSDYKMTPFRIPKSTLTNIMNGAYSKFVMASVKDCAPNSPQFEKFVVPYGPVRVEMDKCFLNLDGFPPHMEEGFYRITVLVTGPFEIKFELYLQVMQALL